MFYVFMTLMFFYAEPVTKVPAHLFIGALILDVGLLGFMIAFVGFKHGWFKKEGKDE